MQTNIRNRCVCVLLQWNSLGVNILRGRHSYTSTLVPQRCLGMPLRGQMTEGKQFLHEDKFITQAASPLLHVTLALLNYVTL